LHVKNAQMSRYIVSFAIRMSVALLLRFLVERRIIIILVSYVSKSDNVLLTCRMCKLYAVEILFLPCCHVVACKECTNVTIHCVICNQNVCGTITAFLG